MANKRRRAVHDIEDSIPCDSEDKSEFIRQFEVIKEWKKGRVADVDIFGCYKLAEETTDAKVFYIAFIRVWLWFIQKWRFQVLVGLLLSSQTKDPITAAAVKRLQLHLKGGLCPASVRETEEFYLSELIKPVGFFRMKAGYLKRICDILEKDGDDIPNNLEDLVKLPGIGPKMVHDYWEKRVVII